MSGLRINLKSTAKFENRSSSSESDETSNSSDSGANISPTPSSQLIPSPSITIADLQPINDKLETVAESMKDLAILYAKAYKINQVLAEENKRLATELALTEDRLRRNSSDEKLASPIYPKSSNYSSASEPGSPPSSQDPFESVCINTEFDDILNTTNHLTAGKSKSLEAFTVKLIAGDLYYVGDIVLKLPPLEEHHEFSSFFENVPLLTKPYNKLIRNSNIDAKQLILCLGFSDSRKTKSYVDCYFLSSESIYPLLSPFVDSIIDITSYDHGFLVSYYKNDGNFDVGYIDCSFVKESTIKKLGSRITSIAPDINFSYVGEFLYSHKSNICFFFNGSMKERKIADTRYMSKPRFNQDERSESTNPKTYKKQRKLHGITDEQIVDKYDQDIKRRSSHKSKRKTSSVNEDIEHNDFKRRPSIKADTDFVLKLHQILKEVVPVDSKQQPVPTVKPKPIKLDSKPIKQKKSNSRDMNNSLFIKKKNHEPEIVRIPESCGEVISAHPYESDYFVLTDKHILLRITGLHDDDPRCKIQELSIFPKDEYNHMYIKEVNDYVVIDGFDKAIFLTTPNSVYRVYNITDDIYYTTKIYSLTGNQSIINLKLLPESLTLYLSNYSLINIHFDSFQLQTYTHVSARIFNN